MKAMLLYEADHDQKYFSLLLFFIEVTKFNVIIRPSLILSESKLLDIIFSLSILDLI